MSVVKNQLQSNLCSLVLVISVLLFSLSQIKGQDVFTVTHRVEPFETRRQGLNQSDPCPGDVIVFTCMSQTSANRVSWMTDIVGTEDLYIFNSMDTDNLNTTIPIRDGISVTQLSNKTFILRIDLRTSVDVINGTGISCGEVDQRMIASSLVPVNIIGPASAPTIVTISPQGLTTLIVDMTVPNTGEICVDNYRTTIMEEGVGGVRLSQEQVVTDATQNLYKFEFSELDLCGEMRPRYTATATAVTNGTEGATATFSTAVNVDNTNIITSAVSARLMFTSAGISVTLSWEVIDQNIMNRFEVECCYIENLETLFNCTYHSTSVTQLSVLFAYDDGDFVGKGITFMVTYQYLMCLDSRATNLTVQNVNSSLPHEVPEQNAVRVDFNEALFDINLVEVMFSSNCTISTIVEYSNPAIIDIPGTGANTGQCRYAILLVTRDNSSQQVGYPIEGIFKIIAAKPRCFQGAVIGGIVAGLALLLLVVASIIGGYCLYHFGHKKRRKCNVTQEMGMSLKKEGLTEVQQTSNSDIIETKVNRNASCTILGPPPPPETLQNPRKVNRVVSDDGGASPPTQRPSKEGKLTLRLLSSLKLRAGERVNIIDQVAPHWRDFATNLDFDPSGDTMQIIDQRNRGDPTTCCRDMMQTWLKGRGRQPATLKLLVDILQECNLIDLAKQINEAIPYD